MRRFTWRLQRVLDIKVTEERVKRKELLELTEELVRTLEELLEQKRILENIIFEIRCKDPSNRLNEQELFLRYAATNNDFIMRLEHKLKHLESQKKEKIAEISAVIKFKEGLEKLRAKAKEEFAKEEEKLEQKQLDDATTLSFARDVIKQTSITIENSY